MMYQTGSKRLVRNPITGEELYYFKGSKQEQEQHHHQAPQIDYNSNHESRVKGLLEAKKSTQAGLANFPMPLSMPQEQEKKKDQSTSTSNVSTRVNATSVPLLNFTDLFSEDRSPVSEEEKKKLAASNKAKLDEFLNSNPIVAPSFLLNQNSARPKSSYTLAADHALPLQSPIMAYKKKLDIEPSPIPSKLEAPRLEPAPIPTGPAIQKKQSIYKFERIADLEKLWLSTPRQPQPNVKTDSDDKTKFLKEKLVEDTIMTDQLSKFVMSEPRAVKTVYTSHGNRLQLLDSHRGPAVNSLTENQLVNRKLKFNCRIKTPNGKIALRELFGILFLADNSLTIYEFRLLCGAYFTGMGSGNASKKANALPFMNRRVYSHAYGRRKGQPVDIWNIYRGAVVYLPSNLNEQTCLPNEMKQIDYVCVEITDVNELEKENLLANGELMNKSLTSDEMNHRIWEIKQRLAQPFSDAELNDAKILNSVRRFLREQIEARSVEVYMGLTRLLKRKSRTGEYAYGYVSQDELHQALVEFNVQIHSEDLNIAWQVIDQDKLGHVYYYDLIRSLLGEMNIKRHAMFRSLMHKLDTLKCGYVQVNDVYKYYKAARHPKVKSGDLNEEQMFRKYLDSFDLLNPANVPEFYEHSTSTDTKSPLIAYEQLEEYYNGLSIVIDSDEDFINILKNSWNQI